jgi:hypothetical protein
MRARIGLEIAQSATAEQREFTHRVFGAFANVAFRRSRQFPQQLAQRRFA